VFHPIKKPECYHQLKKLTHLARLTLAFALQHEKQDMSRFAVDPNLPRQTRLIEYLSEYDAEILAQHGEEEFLNETRAGFIFWFMQNDEKPETAEWLWRKEAAIAQPVLRLLVIPKARKSPPDIIQMFDEDVVLLESFDTAADLSDKIGFNYHQNLIPDSEVRQLVERIMRNFYEKTFRSSTPIPVEVVGGSRPLNRSIFMNYFANLSVCPACDGSHAPILGDRLQTDADHFFPLSKYPFFAIHPLNLIPYCKYCNQPPFKGSKDVLDAPKVMNMGDIFHPYRPARDELKVNIPSVPLGTLPHIHVQPLSDNHCHKARRESIVYLFDLERRWQGELSGELPNQQEPRSRLAIRLKSDLQTRIREAMQYKGAAFVPSNQWLQESLRSIVAQKFRERGAIPGAVTEIAYALWFLKNAEPQAQLLDNLRTFCDGLDDEVADFMTACQLYASEAMQAIASTQ
jgi:hypothetical protein